MSLLSEEELTALREFMTEKQIDRYANKSGIDLERLEIKNIMRDPHHENVFGIELLNSFNKSESYIIVYYDKPNEEYPDYEEIECEWPPQIEH